MCCIVLDLVCSSCSAFECLRAPFLEHVKHARGMPCRLRRMETPGRGARAHTRDGAQFCGQGISNGLDDLLLTGDHSTIADDDAALSEDVEHILDCSDLVVLHLSGF